MFEKHGFPRSLRVAGETALVAGSMLSNDTWSLEVKQKNHPQFGTSSVTEADAGAEDVILYNLRTHFPDALTLAEEDNEHRVFTPEDFFRAPLGFGVDPLDGTTDCAHELYSYSDSIGITEYGQPMGGAIAAPDARGGLLIMGYCGHKVIVMERGGRVQDVSVRAVPFAKPLVSVGVDVQRSDDYLAFIKALPKSLRPRRIASSGALDLGLVAAGRINLLIQSPQFPWDWMGGLPLVEEAGGKIQLYHVIEGRIVPVNGITPEDYRRDKQILGFVLGIPELVDEAFPLLQEHYGKQ